MKPYPLRFRPVFKRTIWGGRRLAEQLAARHITEQTVHVGPAPYVMSDASRKDVWDNGRPKVKLDNVLDEIYKKQNAGTQAKKKVAQAILFEEVNMLLITAFTAAFEGHAELSRLLTEESVKQFKVTTELTDAQIDDPTLMPAVQVWLKATLLKGKSSNTATANAMTMLASTIINEALQFGEFEVLMDGALDLIKPDMFASAAALKDHLPCYPSRAHGTPTS